MSIWNGMTCNRCSYAGCDGGLSHFYFIANLWLRKHEPRTQYRNFKQWLTALDYSKIDDVEVDGIDTRDYPDFCDAYISSASYKGRDMTESELERLNEDGDYVYEKVQDRLY